MHFVLLMSYCGSVSLDRSLLCCTCGLLAILKSMVSTEHSCSGIECINVLLVITRNNKVIGKSSENFTNG